jgi:sec-independent protein translocase protein TatA
MFGLGAQELIIILLIVGLLFGAKKLPELGKGLGQAIKGFKKSMDEPIEKEVTHEKSAEGPAEGNEGQGEAKA